VTCIRAAVREDRTPGGKHRAKKLRGEETDVSTTSVSSGGGPAVLDWNGYEKDELLLSRLLDSKPDSLSTVEGVFDKYFSCILKFCYVCRITRHIGWAPDILVGRREGHPARKNLGVVGMGSPLVLAGVVSTGTVGALSLHYPLLAPQKSRRNNGGL